MNKKYWIVINGGRITSLRFQFPTKQGDIIPLYESYEDAKSVACYESDIVEVTLEKVTDESKKSLDRLQFPIM